MTYVVMWSHMSCNMKFFMWNAIVERSGSIVYGSKLEVDWGSTMDEVVSPDNISGIRGLK
jgi:hypothetical protein